MAVERLETLLRGAFPDADELRVEQERLDLVAELLDDARVALIATRELGDRAKRNGSRTQQ